jgi:hypothetical protein
MRLPVQSLLGDRNDMPIFAIGKEHNQAHRVLCFASVVKAPAG